MDYVTNTPTTGRGEFEQTCFLNVLGYRQGGKSVCAEYAFYVKTAYTPGWEHLTMADNRDRADYLHKRTQRLHTEWDEDLRIPTLAHNETRKLSFVHGGFMHVKSGKSSAAGVGTSSDSFHGSEIFLWEDFESQMSFMMPAMDNRAHALMLNESTPGTADEPSTQYWRDLYLMGKHREGRFLSKFFPFWDGKLNRREWMPGWVPDSEECRLMETYGPHGLTLENLAFRRYKIESDRKIRRNPKLFGVYYPFDDVTCWLATGRSLISEDVLHRQIRYRVPANGLPYQEFEEPEADAQYVIGVDPAGYGRDHSAFVVLKVWDDEWKEVAEYGANVEPHVMVELLLETAQRYNNARIAVERNGVGAGIIAAIKSAGYRNLHYGRDRKPGVHKHSHDQYLNALVDALLDILTIVGGDLYDQIVGYQGDKAFEASTTSILLSKGSKDTKRRDRHHWDKVSALCVAVIAAKSMPIRTRRRSDPVPVNVIPLQMTYDDEQRLIAKREALKKKKSKGKLRYRRLRRPR